ncbi:NADH:flavin oxidoreductase/NADH oxidase [Leucobacter sp. UT-8R-CII-1-4]|uniref:NADH:flavin oxidoreductase/NADH oxidase n=1 Tax=Leucobacter sp. UT-8R-CII-1-4 TaxID=3040075 RepID=UPI0024A883B4|nr:NADH:flavin oxidoreductase/NADH oxidase [Leucobacter sp. UT-8R-CII-1-4]MDI6023316.1 NADH:flavin oxidoreductase/NADH oxidase [Leucobacter sp. UT-8R-CII-1-4]
MANPLLFQPFQLRGLTVRNRLWVPPMCQYSAAAEGESMGVPNDWHLVHLGALARGGAGLVIAEATAVVPEGRISPNDLGLWNDTQEQAFANIVRVIHSHGAHAGIQLAHAGRKASTHPWLPGAATGSVAEAAGGWQTVAPSAIAFGDFADPRALSTSEVYEVIAAFVAAADRAVAAGFDVVQIHAAHGYLLHEFLSPLSNQRDDQFGGDGERRAFLLREIVRQIRAAHPDLPVTVRISGDEWVEGGFNVEAALQLAQWLKLDGADLIDASSAGNTAEVRISIGPSYQVWIADRLRAAGLPVGAVGLITSAQQAESILATGQADVISVGRPLLANPQLPLKWAQELRAPVAAALTPPQYHRAIF